MITTIIFSKDRAAQLDLLLNSAYAHVPELLTDVHVLWSGSDDSFRGGYKVCIRDHKMVRFHAETDFSEDLWLLFTEAEKHVMFLCDDDIFFRPLRDPFPTTILDWRPEVLTVSLRLGMNTVMCYSLKRQQQLPSFTERQRDALIWEWRGAEADWGYPGSVDGNIWRRDQITSFYGRPVNPNNFEESLNSACYGFSEYQVACYKESILFGNPVNIVNETHNTNRHGEMYPHSVRSLNSAYLDGLRLSPNLVDPRVVVAAHCEQRLLFSEVAVPVG